MNIRNITPPPTSEGRLTNNQRGIMLTGASISRA